MTQVDLSKFNNRAFVRGRPRWVEAIWRLISALLFQSAYFPFYAPKRTILRLFGASIGRGVLIKPRVTITFPWKLKVGDHSWIGEEVWLDSLEEIRIGANVCISQRSYLCTGTHDSRSRTFDLRALPIDIGDGAWIGAGSIIAPGTKIGSEAWIQLGTTVIKDVAPRTRVRGNPAQVVGERSLT